MQRSYQFIRLILQCLIEVAIDVGSSGLNLTVLSREIIQASCSHCQAPPDRHTKVIRERKGMFAAALHTWMLGVL